ncbi:MAG: hypothetical protein ACRDLN_12485, partial [Solirubrobacteraceae bacterium]
APPAAAPAPRAATESRQPAPGPEPPPPEPDPAPTPSERVAAQTALDAERTVAILTGMLDDLGADHRPFGRDRS